MYKKLQVSGTYNPDIEKYKWRRIFGQCLKEQWGGYCSVPLIWIDDKREKVERDKQVWWAGNEPILSLEIRLAQRERRNKSLSNKQQRESDGKIQITLVTYADADAFSNDKMAITIKR